MRIGGVRIDQPEWFTDGACRNLGPAAFFPEPGQPSTTARRACDRCAVVEQCLAYAIADPNLLGIWGGTNETQRDQIRSKQP